MSGDQLKLGFRPCFISLSLTMKLINLFKFVYYYKQNLVTIPEKAGVYLKCGHMFVTLTIVIKNN